MKRVRLFEIFGLVVLLALTGIACISDAGNSDGDRLEGVTWALKSYGDPGNLTTAIMGKEPTIMFDEGNSELGGNGGVNSYGGKYEVAGNGLTVSDIVSTAMASTRQSINVQEKAFFNILRSAQSFDIDDGELTITGTAGVLVLKKK